jgi:leucyl-tRNA synthetase
MSGTFRFLNRVWDAVMEVAPSFDAGYAARLGAATSDDERTLRRRTHQTIAKVTENVADFRFNTAVSALMIHSDALRKFLSVRGPSSPAAHEAAVALVKLLAPFAPHIADELWERLGHMNAFLYRETWPVHDPAIAAEEEITLVVQVNGKVRDRITLPADADAKACEAAALDSEKVREVTGGQAPKKVIVVPGKLVNVVV